MGADDDGAHGPVAQREYQCRGRQRDTVTLARRVEGGRALDRRRGRRLVIEGRVRDGVHEDAAVEDATDDPGGETGPTNRFRLSRSTRTIASGELAMPAPDCMQRLVQAGYTLKQRRRRRTMGAKGDELKGRAKEAAGIVTGDEDLEAEGKADRLSGEIKEKVEQAKDKIEEVIDKAKDTLHRK